MEKNNCLRCNFRHTDNGNYTAVGGFCTAVAAAHCSLLRKHLDTGLTPEEVHSMSGGILCTDSTGKRPYCRWWQNGLNQTPTDGALQPNTLQWPQSFIGFPILARPYS